MLIIRKAELPDSEQLADLYNNHLKKGIDAEPPNPAVWQNVLQEILQDSRYFLLVGEQGGKVVASVSLIVIKNLTHGVRPYALIENVVTHFAHRNKGYASALMQRAVQLSQEHGCYKVMLMTGSKKQETLNFYKKCGFNSGDKTAFIRWI